MKRLVSLHSIVLRSVFLLCTVCAGNAASASASCTNAAQDDSVYLVGRVFDGATRQLLKGARAELLTAEGRPVAAMRVGDVGQAMGFETPWRFAVPDKKADYRVRLSKAGYDTLCLAVRFAPERQTTLYYYGVARLWRNGTAEAGKAPRTVEAGPFQLPSSPCIYGQVRDALTDEVKTGVAVDLLTADSLLLWTMYSGERGQFGNTPKAWAFGVPKLEAHYIVRFRAEGYETVCQDVRFRPTGRKVIYNNGTMKLRRPREQRLGTATVTATKVKFYTRKDTLVFNADAFQLAEGSMLDALIRQLPGVELKDDGRIYVNGKYVESLLLNGEEFFRGNNTVMLDNLPSYMVKDVKVYDKAGEMSEFAGRRITNDGEYVMDVQLKRQYAVGWIGNAEGGAGTEDRYLARLFALRFTPQSRLSVYANLNNLNETRKPGNAGDWTPANMPAGLDAPKTGGLDYLVKDKRERYEASGNVQATHLDRDHYSRTSGTNFLEGGDIWSESMRRQVSCNTNVSTSHSLRFKWTRTQLSLRPTFSLQRYKNRRTAGAATFNADPTGVTNIMDSILTPEAPDMLRRLAVNRTRQEFMEDGQRLNAGLTAYLYQDFTRNDDLLRLGATVHYTDSRADRYDHYTLDYPAKPQATADFRNRYYRDRPDRDLVYSLEAAYYYVLPANATLDASYRYYGANRKHDYGLYRLEELTGWGEEAELGMLPSEADWMAQTLDAGNSYLQQLDESEHRVKLGLWWEGHTGRRDGYTKVSVELPLRVTTHRLDYVRAALDTALRRTSILFEPSLWVQHNWHDWQRSVDFNYDLKGSIVNAASLLPIRSDSDPLNVTLGNPDLRDSRSHSFRLAYTNTSRRKERTLGMNLGYTITQDQRAYGYVYNRSTGVRTYRMENVNGNYTLRGGVNYTMPLDRKRRLTFSTNTSTTFYHNVDLIGSETEDGSTAQPLRSTVRTLWLNETLRLDYRFGAVKAGVKGSAGWRGARSPRPDFATVSAVDFNYGLTAQFELPAGFQFHTDLTMYSRRGYDAEGMNADELVWNARLSKSFWKNRLTLMLDGFDMLGNLSAVTHVLNGQGRSETFRNVIPRYAMLHVVYRLNLKPKKRPGDA